MNLNLKPSLLTPREQEAVKRLVVNGVQQNTLARAFGVSPSVIHYTVRGKRKGREIQ